MKKKIVGLILTAIMFIIPLTACQRGTLHCTVTFYLNDSSNTIIKEDLSINLYYSETNPQDIYYLPGKYQIGKKAEWYLEKDLSGEPVKSIYLTGDTSFYAKWIAMPDVTAVFEFGEGKDDVISSFPFYSEVVFPEVTKPDYEPNWSIISGEREQKSGFPSRLLSNTVWQLNWTLYGLGYITARDDIRQYSSNEYFAMVRWGGNLETIIVPPVYEYDNQDYTVIWIAYPAFNSKKKIKKVVLPDTITLIDSSAFRDCSSLNEINIPPLLKVIKGYTFDGCNALERITIPASVDKIEDYAFYSCESLREITVLNDVPPVLGAKVFDYTAWNKVIYVPKGKVGLYRQTPGWADYSDSFQEIK